MRAGDTRPKTSPPASHHGTVHLKPARAKSPHSPAYTHTNTSPTLYPQPEHSSPLFPTSRALHPQPTYPSPSFPTSPPLHTVPLPLPRPSSMATFALPHTNPQFHKVAAQESSPYTTSSYNASSHNAASYNVGSLEQVHLHVVVRVTCLAHHVLCARVFG